MLKPRTISSFWAQIGPAFLGPLERRIAAFFASDPTLTDVFDLPGAVADAIAAHEIRIPPTAGDRFCVTYCENRGRVVEALRRHAANGWYPASP